MGKERIRLVDIMLKAEMDSIKVEGIKNAEWCRYRIAYHTLSLYDNPEDIDEMFFLEKYKKQLSDIELQKPRA